MRSLKTLLIAALAVSAVTPAIAELQNVEVGGQIRIRGNFYDYGDGAVINGAFIDETSYVEQRTRLSVKADFTDEVTAFIEIDSYDIWGEEFRSDFLTGFDGRGDSNDVEMYQAYIEANEMWGTPLRLRVGRQELSFGSEWLVGVNDASSGFFGLSFDALRLDYETDMFAVTAFASKLNETFDEFGDGDSDFYGIYASYKGLEDFAIDAYWLYLRDDQNRTVNDIDIHTIGLRGAGTFGAFDLEAEIAYQFGEVDRPGSGWFAPRDLDIDAFGGNVEVGYTFDTSFQPRIYLGAAYFEGTDGDDNDLAFNRLFSNWEYTEFFANSDESNLLIFRGGLSVMPTESVQLALAVSYFQADEAVEQRRFLFWTDEGDDDLGWEVGLYGTYNYSEDLAFRAGWAHFFGDDGLEDGNFVVADGLGRLFADEDEDFDYLFVETEIKF